MNVSSRETKGNKAEQQREDIMTTNKRPTIKDTKTILIETRHWTDNFGNTYWAGELFLNGKEIHTESFQYGYGSHSQHTIIENAVKAGKLPRRKEKEIAWRYLDRVVGRNNWEHKETHFGRNKDL